MGIREVLEVASFFRKRIIFIFNIFFLLTNEVD